MTRIGSVYGQALYSLAKEENLSQKILEEMHALSQSFQEQPQFLRLISTPNLAKQERCRILTDSFDKMLHPYLLHFLMILTEKGYARHFFDCYEAFREQYNADHQILPVSAVTSVPLTMEQAQRLSEKLAKITGKTIQLVNRVDSSCLGGVRLDFDGKRLDDTVSHRLESMRSLLKNTVL